MSWTQAIAAAAMMLGTGGIAPLTAETTPSVILAAQPADSTWPPIVPRLASYTETQKVAITRLVERYCTENHFPKRAELQARLQRLLTPAQVVEAIQYWLPQDVQRDLRALMNGRDRPTRADDLDTCGQPARRIG